MAFYFTSHTRHIWRMHISMHHSYRLFISGVRLWPIFSHTHHRQFIDLRHIGNTIHLWTAFVQLKYLTCLRLLSADFTELYKLLERAVACSPPFGVLGWRFGTLPPHFTHRNISSPKFRATIALRLCAQAFHLRTCRTIVVSISFQKVYDTPHAKTCADCDYKSF